MRVLFLAPQPFYQERGTPIAVKLALEALSRRLVRSGTVDGIDVLTYAEGEDVAIEGVRILRTPTPTALRGIRPGISLRKLAVDLIFFAVTLKILWRNRGAQYGVVHAVEESVFIAWLSKQLFGIPYIYDMDSSLALQLTEKWWLCRPLLPLLRALERLAVRGSIAVAPVCDALEVIAKQYGSQHTVTLRDVSLLGDSPRSPSPDIAHEIGQDGSRPILMYVGNLEHYQGIDLLLESFSRVVNHRSNPLLVVVGGVSESISAYSAKAAALGCGDSVRFLGPRPVHQLHDYLAAADILVSPRIKGNNTPMKIYSYLHSGRALVATDLPTHRQVLDKEIALLAPPTSEGYARALEELLTDRSLRLSLGERAKERAERLYTVDAFEVQLGALYDRVERDIIRYASGTSTITAGDGA